MFGLFLSKVMYSGEAFLWHVPDVRCHQNKWRGASERPLIESYLHQCLRSSGKVTGMASRLLELKF